MVNEIAFLAAGQSWGANCQAARVRRLRLDTRKATHVALQSTIAERPSLDFLRTGDGSSQPELRSGLELIACIRVMIISCGVLAGIPREIASFSNSALSSC